LELAATRQKNPLGKKTLELKTTQSPSVNEHEVKFFIINKNAKNAKYVTELSLLRKAVHQLKYTTEVYKRIQLVKY
jgi:hypothetical protein